MKKLEKIGRALNREEQKLVVGGSTPIPGCTSDAQCTGRFGPGLCCFSGMVARKVCVFNVTTCAYV